jgi:hypothetical protein
VPDMVVLSMRYYRLSEETAREVIAEMRDTTSLEVLAGLRGARAVPVPTSPNDLAG